MRHPVVRIGPRGGKIVHEGKRPEYERREGFGVSQPAGYSDPQEVARARATTLAATATTGNEHLVAYDALGREVMRRSGTTDRVVMTDQEIGAMRGRGVTVIHGHPNGGSLSSVDFDLLFRGRLKAVEAVACIDESGRRYSCPDRVYRVELDESKLTDQGRKALANPAIAAAEWEASFMADRAAWSAAIKSKKMTAAAATIRHSHAIVSELAERFGLTYVVSGARKIGGKP